MQCNTSDVMMHYHKANGMAVAAPSQSDRLTVRQALPVWLGMAIGGWLVVGLLFTLLVG